MTQAIATRPVPQVPATRAAKPRTKRPRYLGITLKITTDRDATDYRIQPIQPATPDIRAALRFVKVTDRTAAARVYTVLVPVTGKPVCDCPGCTHHKHCRHCEASAVVARLFTAFNQGERAA